VITLDILELLSPIIIEALTIIILALAGIFARWAANWAKQKGIDQMIKNKQHWADLAVRTAKDVYQTGEGDKKLAFAAKWLSDRLHEQGIKITEAEIEGLVRASYQELIGEWKDTLKQNN
jgi:LL-H family phage holin